MVAKLFTEAAAEREEEFKAGVRALAHRRRAPGMARIKEVKDLSGPW
jgi:hypothetical protein